MYVPKLIMHTLQSQVHVKSVYGMDIILFREFGDKVILIKVFGILVFLIRWRATNTATMQAFGARGVLSMAKIVKFFNRTKGDPTLETLYIHAGMSNFIVLCSHTDICKNPFTCITT